MITYDQILFFDTETTGLPPKDAKWETDYEQFPRICQLSWIYAGREENHIIRPDGWEIPQEATDVHGITNEYAQEHGEPLADVMGKFIADCYAAKLICGHNVYFDISTVKSEIMRVATYDQFADDALYKGKRIDTMRPTMKWVDARMANGRLKFPNLSELYSRCFPGETFPAHNAIEDVKAVARCLPVIVELGLVELKVKEYPEEQPNNPVSAFAKIADAASDAAKIAADAAKKFGTTPETDGNGPILGAKQKDDKLPIQPAKAPENENSLKITLNNRLSEMMADENF